MESFRYRWFTPGDLNACVALMLDSLVNLSVLASILTLGFGFPADIVYLKMIPGSTFGVFVGDMLYTWLAVRLANKKKQAEVTAMPLGFDTPSTIGIALAVLGPAFVAAKSDLLKAAMIRARLVWHFMRFSTARWVQRRDAQRDFPSKAKPWPVVQGCYAALLSDAALDWLVNGGVITREERGDAASILLRISAWLEQTDR